MSKRVLVINFGSTSSKFAIYKDGLEERKGAVDYSREELEEFSGINDQIPLRYESVISFLNENNCSLEDFDAMIGRAGGTAPICGVYEINERMVDKLLNHSKVRHVANLCGVIAFELAKRTGIPAYISSFAEDSMLAETKISGLPQIRRKSEGHMENWYAVSRKVCKKIGKKYEESNLIVAHMGGGTTIGLHMGGKIVDVIGDTEGAFGPERSGGLPLHGYLDMVLQGGYSEEELLLMMRGKGGLYAYTGTTDARAVEREIANGNKEWEIVYRAMALQEAKAIASLAATAKGNIDGIALSGGLSRSKMFVGWIRKYTEFIAPVYIFPGEFEMEAMAMSVWDAMEGKAPIHEYTKEIDDRD
ncbi:MAG: butyrate kinase [Eubacterium sp.]|nr:butyrate kinase [Eubacterium sp.]